ncbi:MAG: UDP-N-acetylmuramate--L-alanine ligase [Verrucomicrobiota bacterium]|jgi:UDP-N-acetylmuramate--L-alanine ligase/UDP-N-acetylenolpyruvoylglucosamine reductase
MRAEKLRELLAGPAPAKIHLIGVAGSGMSGIAALLLGLGHDVGGSDKVDTIEVERLSKKGLRFSCPHSAECVRSADLVVFSSAIKPGNPAYDEAARLGIPMVRRADALAAIMASKQGIVVCGMHGKTTTSAMTAHLLRAGGLKPSHYVGAEIPILGTNARWDSEGAYFVAEGDESDGTLVNYHPRHAIVLNIEPEHLDYYEDLAAIDAVYQRLVSQTSGSIIYCADDRGASRVCSENPRAISYGHSPEAHYRIVDLTTKNFCSYFRVRRGEEILGEITLNIPGAHNALNSLAAIALATEVGVPFEKISPALESFRGARRRFEILYDSPRQIVVDDYGHHPTEIAATIATARTGPNKRVVVMFQPHRFTRTQALKDQFGMAFQKADHVFISDIYPASESRIPGITGQTLVDSAIASGHSSAHSVPSVSKMHKAAGAVLEEGDLVLSLGAGNIHEAGARLVDDLKKRDQLQGVMEVGRIKLYEPLSKHTTMRVGGPAQFWAEPETEEGFADLVRFCFDENIPLMVMGRGSNLLVRDGGIPGVVVHLARGEFAHHEIQGMEISAGVGVKLKQLTGLARAAGIAGFEWMEGIPGNLGGGLRMNAGAMGIQTFDQVVRIRFCDQDGNIFTKTPAEIEVHYRNVPMLRQNFALSAVLRGQPGNTGDIDSAIAASVAKRRSSQPVAASAGCIFKNPAEIPAGRLIEELGLKNHAFGAARVSEIHGNFIVNDGGASASDILALIGEIQKTAKEKRGITLETEVQITGVDL